MFLAPGDLKTWLIFCMFVGGLLVVHGIYDEKLQAARRAAKDNVKVEYRFIPRTYYEEQLSDAEGMLSDKFKSMFDGADPMTDR
jgi:hypothetical protein